MAFTYRLEYEDGTPADPTVDVRDRLVAPELRDPHGGV